MKIGAMYVDKYPVTNAQYATYLAASHYLPSDSANWLKENFHKNRNRGPKPGWERKPVTYVSLEDARHYCSFNSKRLPHAYEWQYFAQGTDGRRYPWGNEDNLTYTPSVNNNWTNPQGHVQSKIILLTQNVLEDTKGVLRPPPWRSVSSRKASYATSHLY